MLYSRRPQIPIKSDEDLANMRRASRLAAQCLAWLIEQIEPGMTTQRVDDLHMQFMREHGTRAAPPMQGFPRSVCTSINEIVCHGIPSAYDTLKEGDLLSLDVSLSFEGFFGDNAATIPIGEVSAEANALMWHALEALRHGVEAVAPGKRIGDLSWAIQSYAETHGYSVVEDFGAHGIGTSLHEPPQILHVGKPGRGPRLRPGMTFTLEPMLNIGGPEVRLLKDGWSAATKDKSLSAQYEHTLAVTEEGVEILTVHNNQGCWEPPGGFAPTPP